MARKQYQRPSKKLTNSIVLLVDGEVELKYFSHIGLGNYINAKVKVRIGRPDEFIKLVYEEVPHVIILDIDNVTSSGDNKKRDLLYNITNNESWKNRVFFNNYSFELFLISHKVSYKTPVLKKEDYDTIMKKQFGLTNRWSKHKNDNNIKKVLSKIDEANIQEALRNLSDFSNEPFANPSSNMSNFFKIMNGLAQELDE